ncbi:carbohydrate sulfotransferase 15-like isoform X2 [Apostichopus japonicus]
MPKAKWKPYLPEVLERFPAEFSNEFRNPCWYEGAELQCVPYFYQLGACKCGTTDVWDKLIQHPDVLPVAKEPHWWALRRFGYTDTPIHRDLVLEIRNKTGQQDDSSVQWYLNLYRQQAVKQIQQTPTNIFGDASITNLWGLGMYYWEEHFPNETSPPVFLSDLIHAVQPKAKIVVILRDPVDLLWTSYMIGIKNGDRTPEKFEIGTKKYLKEAANCESVHNPLYCAFMCGPEPHYCLGNKIYQGIFYLYLREWVEVFGLENIHVMRLEDWKEDPIGELEGLIKYLELAPLPHQQLASIVGLARKNVNKEAKSKNMTMLPSTRRTAQDFYRPWNKLLAGLLKDQKYTWSY